MTSIPPKIKAVIFDMDGVLLLSGPVHETAYEAALAEIGIYDFAYHRFAGMRTDECLGKVLQENHRPFSEELLHQLTERKRALAHRLLKKDLPILPECRSILSSLYPRYRLGLCSSASRENVELFLESSRCRNFFCCVVHGDEVKRAKPNPEVYMATLAKLRVVPEECLVIEDAASGVLAAKAAGMLVYAVLGTTESDALKKAGADDIMADLNELV